MLRLNKENIKKYLTRGASLILAMTMIGALAGCKKKSLLEGTMLEDTMVATVDGEFDVIKEVRPEYCFNLEGISYPIVSNLKNDHDHYYSVISESYYTTDPKCTRIKWGVFSSGEHDPHYASNVDIKGYIIHFLTEEELKLASENKLTNDDIIEITERIKREYEEEKIQKRK